MPQTLIQAAFVAARLQGQAGRCCLQGADAQPKLALYDGPRPRGYSVMKKGSLILGIGGDNSDGAIGTWLEGVMTAGYSPDAVDDKVQADVAAWYGAAQLLV